MRSAAALLLALLVVPALPAQAEVYKWRDEQGQVHYSNSPPPSAGGRLQPVEERMSIMGLDPQVRAAAERRFAQQARDEEIDWQRRQQALALQVRPAPAQVAPAPAYPTYAYPYPRYFTAYVPRPVVAPVHRRYPRR